MSIGEKVKLLKDLPSGSGINGEWYFSLIGDNVHLHNDFEPINENGFYDGSVLFSIVIPKNLLLCENWQAIATDFVLHFHGGVAQYMERKYFLRNYLEDTFANYFQELAEKEGL